jgi:hypothetical protein
MNCHILNPVLAELLSPAMEGVSKHNITTLLSSACVLVNTLHFVYF